MSGLPPKRAEGGSFAWPRLARALAGVRSDVSFAAVDCVIIAVSYMAALVIRFADRQGAVNLDWWKGFWVYLPFVIGVHLLTNALFGAYGHVWEFASVEEAMRLVLSSLVSAAVLVAGLMAHHAISGSGTRLIPLTVVLIGSGLALGGMGAVRFRSRLFSFRRSHDLDLRRALVVGSGRAAADLARHGQTAHPPMVVVGFVDDRAQQRRLAGIPVLGGISDLPDLVRHHQVDEVVIATSAGPRVIRRVVDLCVGVDARLRTLPDLDTFLESGGVGDVRDLELSDLLPRATVSTDMGPVAELIEGRRVLVTGAGGSIGSEIVKQVSRFAPAEVVALDHDEGHLYEASLGWSELGVKPVAALVDICDRRGLQTLLDRHRPQVVFHAAAHKHVPILEEFPEEAVKTNVGGTANLIDAVKLAGVERFVLISTDKAVEPSSAMGASKRVAEMLVQSAADSAPEGRLFSAVRFGNVLGSRGSVVPTFMRQIREGGPVTVSDPNMLRFFMLTSEAVELVLQCAALARGGEIFVLDMGEPVRIGDLAHRMIRLAGLVPGRDIQIKVVGARAGEKTIEVLSHQPLKSSDHPQIHIAAAPCPTSVRLTDAVVQLGVLAARGDRRGLRDSLMALAWQTWSGDDQIDLDLREVANFGEPA
jgi:FlaA1/EpsC-like NDP-sugar epimerase